MNLLLLEPDEIGNGNTVCLHDRRARHIREILGCSAGDIVRAGVINGPVGSGEILAVRGQGNKTEVVLRFTPGVGHTPLPAVDLILGLVRPIMLKRILSQVASLGVGRIFLVNASRVEKSFFSSTLLKDGNYRPYLVEGLEQAKDTYLPQVSIHPRFRPFVEDVIPAVAGNYGRMLMAHPEEGRSLVEIAGRNCTGRTLLAVGPEGGWIDFEIRKFTEHSFVAVSLGHRVLRTDTAVVALLAQIMLLQGRV